MHRKRARTGPRHAGRRVRLRGAAATAAVLLPALLLWAADAAAQCALCGQGTRYAGSSPGRALASLLAGTIVLLVPPVSVAAALGRFLWKHRRP